MAKPLTAKDLGLATEEEEEALDVLDLPQLYSKPSATTLLSTLSDISSEPPSWDATPCTPLSGAGTPDRKKRKIKSQGLPSYLTAIISSPLAWLDRDEEREQVWEAASQRLSERSGRTAMGAIDRKFAIPLAPEPCPDCTDGESAARIVELTLHEPALTSDNLGLKTWASSFLCARRMHLLQSSLPALNTNDIVLELGSGTGLVGLAAAIVLKAHVFLTDLPEIVPNLQQNVYTNSETVMAFGGKVDVAVLDWSDPASFNLNEYDRLAPNSFRIIIATDTIYSEELPRLLTQTIAYHLSKSEDARVIVEIPLREAFGEERENFEKFMDDIGLRIIDDGEDLGYDDWTSHHDDDELAEVRCWWSVWAWR